MHCTHSDCVCVHIYALSWHFDCSSGPNFVHFHHEAFLRHEMVKKNFYNLKYVAMKIHTQIILINWPNANKYLAKSLKNLRINSDLSN